MKRLYNNNFSVINKWTDPIPDKYLCLIFYSPQVLGLMDQTQKLWGINKK